MWGMGDTVRAVADVAQDCFTSEKRFVVVRVDDHDTASVVNAYKTHGVANRIASRESTIDQRTYTVARTNDGTVVMSGPVIVGKHTSEGCSS